ncbi:hypothetical protein ES703_14211 [subsurface metagenome]
MLIIPQEELSLTDKKKFCNEALEAGIARAEAKAIGTRAELVHRHAQTALDFGMAAATNYWLTQTLGALPGPFTVFGGALGIALVPQLANNKVAVFYKVSILSTPNPFTILRFGLGPTANAPVTTKEHLDLEQIEGYMTAIGFLSEPVTYDPQEWVNVCVENKINTGAREQLVLSCYIIEPQGGVIS